MDNNSLIAAMAGAAVAIIGVVVAKDTKVSDFRQAWIDALRDDVARLCSLAAASLRERKAPKMDLDKVRIIADEFTHLLNRVRLRLDLKQGKKKKHGEELNEAIVALLKVCTDDAASFDQLEEALNRVSKSAAVVLDTAWRRVKRGETRFLWVLWSAVAGLIFFGGLWIYQWRHPSSAEVNCITLQQLLNGQQAPAAPPALPTPPHTNAPPREPSSKDK
jgi:hypothetical protein